MAKFPFAQPVHRVPRSLDDDRLQKGQPLCPKRGGIGVVTSLQGDTCTVLISEEELTGAIPLGQMPTVGAIVEIESRCDLLVIIDWWGQGEFVPVCAEVLTAYRAFQGFDSEGDPADLGPIWSDQDDATFTVQYGDDFPADNINNWAGAALPPYTLGQPIIGATIHLRASATRADDVDEPVHAQFDIYQDSLDPGPEFPHDITYTYSTPLFDIPADGVIRDIDVPIDVPSWSQFHTAMEGLPGIELYFDDWGGSVGTPNRVLTVYEVALEVAYQCNGVRRLSRPGNSVLVDGSAEDPADWIYDNTSPEDWACGDNDTFTSRTPTFTSGQAHGDYGVTFVYEGDVPDPVLTSGSETVPDMSTVVNQRAVVIYSSDYPVTATVVMGDGIPLTLAAAEGYEMTMSSETRTSDFLRYAHLFIQAVDGSGADETYAVTVHEWWIESVSEEEEEEEPALLMARAVPDEPVQQQVTVTGNWVARYAGDGTRIDEAGVSQGGERSERSLVGFDVNLPSDADVYQVRLKVPWTDWAYANGVGSLVLGWHDSASAPDAWSVGAGAAQMSDHDAREEPLDLVLGWAPSAIEAGRFRGLAIGPGNNDGALYTGSTEADAGQWTLTIQYLSAQTPPPPEEEA